MGKHHHSTVPEMMNIRPIVRWYQMSLPLVRWLVGHIPPHEQFIEPFGGACQVIAAKPVSPVELFNDKDGDVAAFFQVLRKKSKLFQRQLSLVPYDRTDFEYWLYTEATGDVDRAMAFYITLRQAMATGWPRRPNRKWFLELRIGRCGMAKHVAEWLAGIDRDLPLIVERLRGVEFTNMEAKECIEIADGPNALFFLDPPFWEERTEALAIDGFIMTDKDQVNLLDQLIHAKGNVMILGRHCSLYDRALTRWSCYEYKDKKNVLWIKKER